MRSLIVMASLKIGSAHLMTRHSESGSRPWFLKLRSLRFQGVTRGPFGRRCPSRSCGVRRGNNARARRGHSIHSLSKCYSACLTATQQNWPISSCFSGAWKKVSIRRTSFRTLRFCYRRRLTGFSSWRYCETSGSSTMALSSRSDASCILYSLRLELACFPITQGDAEAEDARSRLLRSTCALMTLSQDASHCMCSTSTSRSASCPSLAPRPT